MRYLADVLPEANVVYSTPMAVAERVKETDLLVGAVLIPGAKAPRLVTREHIASMSKGSVIVDVAIDQGGCIETSKPTTHSEPIFVEEGVIHYCVTNMPGGVPRTSTMALSNATLPYAMELANQGFEEAVKSSVPLQKGVNTYAGKLTYEAVGTAFGMAYTPVLDVVK